MEIDRGTVIETCFRHLTENGKVWDKTHMQVSIITLESTVTKNGRRICIISALRLAVRPHTRADSATQ
jgi:hypothetical protein